jgi:rhodanese-related sulfurtransferase
MHNDGYVYLDVRSEHEFEAGHPAGAYNVPLMHMAAGGMVANPDFIRVVSAHFHADARLIVGCKAGGRSLRAASALVLAGFGNVVDQCAGFDGERDAFGAVTSPGWARVGLAVEEGQPPGRSYGELKGQCTVPTRA